jgi:acid phosphatase
MNSTRLAKLLSFVDFQYDVAENTLPQYAHLSPDMLNDGHNTSLAYATNWTQSFLTPLLANEQFMKDTLILLTYDESETYSVPNRIVSILLGGAVPDHLKGTEDGTLYSHYSILSTLENNWDLPNLGRYDVGANVFDLVAQRTGYTNHPPQELVNNSLSYDGFLNWDPHAYLPIPPPNLQLTGAGGQGVLDTVFRQWRSTAHDPTPYDGSGDLYDGGDGHTAPNAPVYKPQAPNVVATDTYSYLLVRETTAPAKRSGAMRTIGLDVTWACIGLAVFIVKAFVF